MRKVAVIVPVYNEELVIEDTLRRLISLVGRDNIFVISDASTDNTKTIVKKLKVNYTRTRTNNGKVKNLEIVIKRFKILRSYKYVSIIDADSVPDKKFYINAFPHFRDEDVACVCGQIESQIKQNIFVAYRSLMYFVWQNLYKRICSYLGVVTIAPGTASVFRSRVLKNIDFDPEIIIEDFDMTFQIHRKKLGKIVYEPKAKIVTQDPDNIIDTLKQVTRWQVGFFQSARKHRVPFKLQPLDLALFIFTMQGVIHALFLTTLIPLVIWLFLFASYPSILGYYFYKGVYYQLFLVEVIYLGALFLLYILLSGKKLTYIKYIPFVWGVSLIYVSAFFNAIYQLSFKSVRGSWVSPRRRL